MTIRELQVALGIKSRGTVYSRIRSDPKFPRPRRVAPHTVVFVRAEVDAYVQALPVVELDGVSAVDRRTIACAARQAGASA
jgi:predicted DNA-binding transcriptional regulator AlpA